MSFSITYFAIYNMQESEKTEISHYNGMNTESGGGINRRLGITDQRRLRIYSFPSS